MISAIYHAIRNTINGALNRFWLRRSRVRYGSGLVINGRLFIRNRGGSIVIGNDVRINSAHWANPIGGSSQTTIVVGPGATLIIENRVGISNATIVCFDRVTIGEGTLIGGDVRIYDTDFHSLKDSDRGQRDDSERARMGSVEIARETFVGAASIILRSSSIGARSVVGAGSVVRGLIPPDELWLGNPAEKRRDLRK